MMHMAKMTRIKTNIGTARVASVKEKHILNIADAAQKCDYIDKIILFGSCINHRCREDSDIDIAVFGNQSKGRCLTSQKYEAFLRQIFAFDHFSQAYDILYFKTGDKKKSDIMYEIEDGEILYVRKA